MGYAIPLETSRSGIGVATGLITRQTCTHAHSFSNEITNLTCFDLETICWLDVSLTWPDSGRFRVTLVLRFSSKWPNRKLLIDNVCLVRANTKKKADASPAKINDAFSCTCKVPSLMAFTSMRDYPVSCTADGGLFSLYRLRACSGLCVYAWASQVHDNLLSWEDTGASPCIHTHKSALPDRQKRGLPTWLWRMVKKDAQRE